MLTNLATVRKDDDPILKTQTNPISYKKKMEELKDGVKGPPSPSYVIYSKINFFVDPPMDSKYKRLDDDGVMLPEVEDLLPQEFGEVQEEAFDASWWGEDWDDSSADKGQADSEFKQDSLDSW
ncbi:MAG: hypothetical protein Q8R76_08885 [Candidatus Omnitrophota bacterium]|nr:hypothetical protein [Candidatus Omnitrophota bacterium]